MKRLLATLFALSLMPSAYAFNTPQELAGHWWGEDGRRYEIMANGPQVIVEVVLGNGQKNAYIGNFTKNGVDLVFRAQNPEQITSSALPREIAQTLVQQRHPFLGRLEFPEDGKIQFTYYWDTFRFRENPYQLVGIEAKTQEYTKVLSREDGYKVGEVQVTDEKYQRRVTERSRELEERIARLKNETIPGLDQEITRMISDLSERERAIETQNRELNTLTQQMRSLAQQIQSTTQRENPAYQALVNQKSQRMEELQAITATRDEYIRRGNTSGVTSMQRQIQQKLTDIRNIETRMAQQFPQQGRVTEQEAQLEQLRTQQKALANRISEAALAHDSRIETLRNRQMEKLAKHDEITNLERLLDYIRQVPFIEQITLKVEGRPYYEAYPLGRDHQDVIQSFSDQIDMIDEAIKDAEQSKQEAKQMETELVAPRTAARAEFDEAVRNYNIAGDALSDLMSRNWKLRGAVEFGGNALDVVIAARQGGWAGVASEMASKLMEAAEMHYVQGKDAFTMFDETQLREAYFGNNANMNDPVTGFATDFGVSQLHKAPITAATDWVPAILERRGLQNQLVEAGRVIAQTNPFPHVPVDMPQMQARLGEATRALQNARNMETMLSATGNLVPSPNRFANQVAQAQQNWSRAFAPIRELNRIQAERSSTLRTQFNRMRQAQEGMQKIKADMAKGLAAGLAVDALKAELSAILDNQEQQAWTQLFEREVYFQICRRNLFEASNTYWEAVDTVQRIQDYIEALKAMRKQVEQERNAFAQALQQGGNGFVVLHSDEFYTRQQPIEFEIVSSGYSFGEDVYLLKSDPKSQGAPRVQARPIENNAPLTMGQPGQSMERHTYRYSLNGRELQRVQYTGQLPLLIELK